MMRSLRDELAMFVLLLVPPSHIWRRRERWRRGLVLHQLQGQAERGLRFRADPVDLVGLAFALQDDPSPCQFSFGVFEVVDFNSDMADDRSLAILELRHAE